MSSAQTSSAAVEMAAASTFSYAQAAKGQGAPVTQATSSNTPSQVENDISASTTEQATTSPEKTTEVAEQTQAVESHSQSAPQEKQDVENSSVIESDTRAESVQERRSETRRDDEASRLDRPWRRNDKGTRSSSATTRSVDDHHESRRPRKGKKGKTTEKQTGDSTTQVDQESKEEEPKIALVEASVPSVNIWQQRKEAAAAKKPEEPSNGMPVVAQATPAADATSAVRETAVNGVKHHQKSSEINNKSERNGSRGSRLPAKDVRTELPPSVQDASAWPTPEIAIKEEKKPVAEKVARPEEKKEAQDEGKAHKKKEWVTYDYVPTVSFETQIPSMRGSKPRGGAKGTNGTRTAAGPQSSEKASTVSPSSKTMESKARETSNGANGATSVPATAKQASADAPREQRKSAPAANADKKDALSSHQADHPPATREGRGERGRGAFRGRGSHHASNSHAQHQHSASLNAASFPSQGPRPHGPFNSPPRQGGQGQMYMAPPPRGGRGGRNGGSTYHRMSLPNGSARIAPVQTQFGPYDYAVPPMTAVPFQQPPYWDNMVVGMLRNQIEYYFSIENLCKDMYLRQRMDSQGFVPLMFITAFKRMRELSPDTALIRSVCEESNEIDFVVGEDDVERLRRRQGWQNWVLPLEDRDELARNHGPAQLTYKSRAFAPFSQQFNGLVPYGVSSPPAYPPQGVTPFTDEHHVGAVNGYVNGNGSDQGVHSQLSADVPDFSPSHPVGEHTGLEAAVEALNVNGVAPAVNGLTNGVHAQE